MGRRYAAVDPRLRPVAQFPSARRPALYGRHSDQHGRRLRRFPGDRSDRLQICRGLQGRQCAAIRRQFAGRRDQFRDADRARSVPQSGYRPISAASDSGGCRPMPAAPTAHGTVLSPPPRRQPKASGITALGRPRASAAMSAINSRPISRRASISMPTRCGSAFPGSVTKTICADFAGDRGSDKCHQRLATQPRHRSHRQQEHHPPRQHHHRFRRVRGRPAPDASDLPVARLPLQGLRRFCQGHRRPHHRRLPQQVRCRLQHPQRHHRRPAIRQCRRAQGRRRRRRCCRSRKTIRPMRKIRSTSCRTSRSSRARNISSPCATSSVNFSTNGDVNGRSTFSVWSPKVGVLWDVDPTWQVFGNISRSAEVPSFGESVSPNFLNPNFPTIPFFLIKPQIATTYEIGTRGNRPGFQVGADRLPRQHPRRAAVPI